MEATITGPARYDVAHGSQHSLDNIVGYEVVRTLDPDGQPNGVVIAYLPGAGRYSEALDMACHWRTGKTYAVVANRYGCGCSETVYTTAGGTETNSRDGLQRTIPTGYRRPGYGQDWEPTAAAGR